MTAGYILASMFTAPGLLAGLLVSAGWIVWLAVRNNRLTDELDQRDAEIEQLSAALVGRGRTCVELGACASALVDDHADRAGR